MTLRDDLRITRSEASFDDVVERLRDIIRERRAAAFGVSELASAIAGICAIVQAAADADPSR